jgi:hypothetical protein
MSLFQTMQTATGWKLKFSGTVDVTKEQQQQILDSGLALMVVAARTGKAEVDFKENGDVGLTLTLRISDSILVTGQSRENAITFLANGPDQGHLVFPNYGYDGAPVPEPGEPPELPEGGFDLPAEPEFDVDVDDEDFPPAETEVIGRIDSYRDRSTPEPSRGGDGPKVAKFNPDDMAGAPSGGTQVVGRVYPPGHKGTDKVLADFIAEERPRGG